MFTTTRTMRRQRLAAVALSLPLALSLTGTALATGPAAELRPTAAAVSAPDKGSKPESSKPESKKVEAAPAEAPLTAPQPLSTADRNGTGANPGETCTHAYCSTRNGSASQNGVGDGGANGKPCAGCVGKADNKHPEGQAPNGTDANAGYECDRNLGIGQSNPAHTGCATAPVTATAPKPTKTAAPKPTKQATPKPTKTASAKPTKQATPKPTKSAAGNSDNAQDKVTICHATGSATNPYVVISPSKQGVLSGHVGHQDSGDIIPPFSYVEDGVTKQFPGQNWNATTQELFSRGCAAPAAPAAPPVCPTSAVMGPVQAGCQTPTQNTPITGQPPALPAQGPGKADDAPGLGGGTPIAGQPAAQPATRPATRPVRVGPPTGIAPAGVAPAVAARGTVTPLAGVAAAPARARAVPSALPFTGTDAVLLAELGALLLLVGGGLLVVVRRERSARAAA